jgi:hypothetical protein
VFFVFPLWTTSFGQSIHRIPYKLHKCINFDNRVTGNWCQPKDRKCGFSRGVRDSFLRAGMEVDSPLIFHKFSWGADSLAALFLQTTTIKLRRPLISGNTLSISVLLFPVITKFPVTEPEGLSPLPHDSSVQFEAECTKREVSQLLLFACIAWGIKKNWRDGRDMEQICCK